MNSRWAALLLAAAALLFHARVLFTAEYALPWDLRNYHLPLVTAYADALAEGEFPYWEPYSYCGRPLAANPQAAVFYPTVALAAAFGRQGLLDRLEWNVVLHVWLAGWFAFLLARRMGSPPLAALAAGLIYSLGGFFASQAQHMGSVMAAAWLPFAWEAALLGSFWRVALAVWMAALAGFTPMTIVVVTTTALWNWRSSAGIAAGLGLAAFQLGPAFDLMQESVAKYRTDWLASGGGLPWQSLASLLWPNAYGIFDLDTFRQPLELTFLYVFCGWTGLALALWGGRRGGKLAVMTASFVLAMLGQATPLGQWAFAVLPAFVQRSFYWYPFLAAFTLGVALLAARALESVRFRPYLVAAVAFELILMGSGRPMNTQSLPREPGISLTQIDGSAETMTAVRRLAGPGRIDTLGDSMLWSSGAPLTLLRSANGYDPLALEKLIQVRLRMAKGARWGAYYQIEKPEREALRAMAVTAVVTRQRMVETSGLLQLAAELPGRFVYQVVDPAPRIEWPGMLEIHQDARNRTRLRLTHSQPATLVIRDAWTPAWQAKVDGRPVPIRIEQGAFRGIAVPPGQHDIVLEIDRWRFWRWSLLSAAVLALSLWLAPRAIILRM